MCGECWVYVVMYVLVYVMVYVRVSTGVCDVVCCGIFGGVGYGVCGAVCDQTSDDESPNPNLNLISTDGTNCDSGGTSSTAHEMTTGHKRYVRLTVHADPTVWSQVSPGWGWNTLGCGVAVVHQDSIN